MEIEKWEEKEAVRGRVLHTYCADTLKIREAIDRVVSFKEAKRR